jgi:ribosomal protein S12 methylthiotransferase
MLLAMRRERSGAAIRRLLARIRAAVPGIALRSSFIVGFPGERERHVDELCAFLDEAEFDHVGVFRYSREEGTTAAPFPDQVREGTKQARWERVMAVQAAVSARRMRAQVGRTADVLIESEEPAGELLGRTATQAPEIDGVIRVRGEAAPGDLVRVRVTGAGTYDLAGEIIPEVDSPAPAH